ncbi:hypothetical protein Q0590_06385 [Rhodocytophaga aerolata]|uniref:DUF3575 domain-containing protein n=1 Tax=Rhodocytophaga aerolata TaxID=455078 RepID=A0ABT8R5D5_9BACT|nr:hypothetical protein [Rhodocytophaga aerolata]MDO1445870.1 hypothetical protein [Rhodocytophaga aerolata]
MRQILLLLLFIILIPKALAQTDSLQKKNILSLNATQILLREIQIGYERFVSSRSSLEVVAAIRMPKQSEFIIVGDKLIGFFDNDQLIHPGASQYASLAFKHSLVANKSQSNYGLYLSTALFYRYRYYENKYYEFNWNGSYGPYRHLESKYEQLYGGKGAVGYRFKIISLSEKVDILIDSFIGVTIGENLIKYQVFAIGETYTAWEDLRTLHPPRIYQERESLSTINLGVKIGIAIN